MKNKYLLVCLVVANGICANIDPGSLDDSFGTSGLVITDFNDVFPGGGASEIYSLVLQADGKIVAVGGFDGPGAIPTVFALARYNTDGTIDDSFGDQGLVITDFNDVFPGGNSSFIYSLVLQADGKIVAGGGFDNGSNFVFALARYNIDGTTDESFGDQGLVITCFKDVFPGVGESSINSLVLQADGKIVAGGGFDNGSNFVFALARYNTDGTPDESFGDQGLVITDFNDGFPGGGRNSVQSLVLQADGKIVAGGRFDNGSDLVFALARYNIDGTIDDSFGDEGLVITDFNDVFPGGGSSSIYSLVLQADGKVVAGGRFYNGSDLVFALARYNTDGTPDDSFGDQGLVITDFNDVFPGGGSSFILSLVLQADGKIVAGGFFNGPGAIPNVFALVRYNTDGTPDDSFGDQGLVMTNFNDVFPGEDESIIESLVLQDDGKIIAGGLFDGPGAIPNFFALARYNTGVATSKIPQSIFGKYAKSTDKNKQLNW